MSELLSDLPATAQATDVMRPVAARERIEVIDILRGCAVLGILLVNMPLYGWPNWGPLRAMRADLPGSLADEIAGWFIWLFAEDKFYPLLSFLFGLGFSLQLLRAEERGTHFLSVFRRRLFILLVIGLLHAFFIWSGDILSRYALLGFLLIPFRAWKERSILAVALVCVLLPIALLPVQKQLHDRSFTYVVDKDESNQRLWDQSMRAYTHGSFAEMTAERGRGVAWTFSWCIGWLQILGLFLLGLYAGRRRFLQNLSKHLQFLRKAIWWALALGIMGMLVRAGIIKLPETQSPYANGLLEGMVDTCGFLAVSFFYAAAIILLAQREAWKTRLSPLSAVGRMALSNYLFQSLVCTTLFYGYGFRLLGKLGPAALLGLTFAIFAIQIPLSVWWSRRFRFGPMEWVWRSLTYGKLQPMRL